MVGFVLYRRALERIDLFDENIFPAYHEDTDYYMRLKRADMFTKPLPRGPHGRGAIFHGHLQSFHLLFVSTSCEIIACVCAACIASI
jgi:hypothetical protein